MSVTKGILQNSALLTIQKLVRVLDQLLLVPFFLTQWGAEYYGEWLTLTIIPSILAFSDLGVGTAAGNGFVLAYTKGDKQRAADISKCGLLIASVAVMLGMLITVGVLLSGDYFGLFDKSLIDAHEAMLAVSLLMASRLSGFFAQLIEGYFRAARKAPMAVLFHIGYGLLTICVSIIVLYAGCGVVGYSLSVLVAHIVYSFVYFIYGRSLVDFEKCRGVVRFAELKGLMLKGLGYLADPIWQAIYFQGSTFVVRIVLGPASVAMFNTVRTVCRSVNQLFSIVNFGVFPEMQYEYGRGNLPIVQRLFRVSILVSLVIALCGFVVLLFAGPYIYNLWTHNELIVPSDVWLVFMLGVVLNAIWWTAMVVYRVTNKPYHFAVVATIMASLSVGMSYILAGFFGLLGVALGALLFDVVMVLFVPNDACKLLSMSGCDLWTHFSQDLETVKSVVSNRLGFARNNN
ncbi:MAG: hypothetical protein HUJ96_04475 [Marinilabiliaceae bacterium]|nr:hypothetical protein [Marinilabiliaceae bacterium]